MIEEFIRNNKNSFEEELSQDHLERFTKKLGPANDASWSRTLNRYLAVAAIVVVIITFGFIALLTSDGLYSSDYLLSNITPELYETETYYQSEINQKLEIISNQREVKKSIKQDLLEIDKSFKTIKKDLDKNPGDERLISAVLNTYQIKLDLLNEILDRIN